MVNRPPHGPQGIEDNQVPETNDIGNRINVLLKSKQTLDHLFYVGQNPDKIELDLGSTSRIQFNNIATKNPVFTTSSDINKILFSPINNSETLEKRRIFFEYLLGHADFEDLFTQGSQLRENIRFGKLQEREGENQEGPLIHKKFLRDFRYQDIISWVQNNNQADDTIEVLISCKKCIENFYELSDFIESNFSDNLYIKHQALVWRGLMNEYGFDRDFNEVIRDLKNNDEYFTEISRCSSKILRIYRKFMALLQIVIAIKEFNMHEVGFDSYQPSSYTHGVSPLESHEKNIPADSLPDKPVVIFRAPNGIGKSFYIEKDILLHMFAQSICHIPAQDGNLKIYSAIYMLHRMESSGNHDDLSALGKEGKYLDDLYKKLENSTGNILIFLDETGSTTDEESEFQIISSFLGAVSRLPNGGNIEIRISTHNQKLIDYYKNKDPDFPVYTFSDERELYKGERDSDTLNVLKKLIQTSSEEKGQDFTQFQTEIADDIEAFLNGKMKVYEPPKNMNVLLRKPMNYTVKQQKFISESPKGFQNILPDNNYGDYKIAYKNDKAGEPTPYELTGKYKQNFWDTEGRRTYEKDRIPQVYRYTQIGQSNQNNIQRRLQSIDNIALVRQRQLLLEQMSLSPENSDKIEEYVWQLARLVYRFEHFLEKVYNDKASHLKPKYDFRKEREIDLERWGNEGLTEQYVDLFLNSLQCIETPLARSLYEYHKEIFHYILGNIQNWDDILEYLKNYHAQYREQGYLFGNSHGLYRKQIFNIDDDLNLNNLFSNQVQNHGFVWTSHNGFRELNDASKEIINQEKVKVKFTKKRKLVIKGMRGGHDIGSNIITNDVELTPENPIEIVSGFNSSGKTWYIKNILASLNQAFSEGYVNAKSMQVGAIDDYIYIDRMVTNDLEKSSGQQDISYWMETLYNIKDNQLVIINVDEIFSTMDKKYSTAFAYTFVGRLLEMGNLAIIVSHNHEFIRIFSELKGVQCSKFDSKITPDEEVYHTYKKVPGQIQQSAGPAVLKTLGYGEGWLY